MGRIKTERGVSLIDVIVGMAIMLIVFAALFTSFTNMLEFSTRNRLHANALMLANEHLETIRALPYDSVGTVAGLPPGSIPQNETIVYDGTEYTRRTFIQYIDDSSDGLGAADSLAADYKRAKVELSYSYHGLTQSFSLTTTVAPKSQESLAGAGILRINVTDASNAPLGSASVHVVNTTVATSVDITTFTNASGTVSFPGAWAGTGYEVYVTKAGYSSAQTYTASTTNPNPSPSPLTVAENSTTEIYLKIDRLSRISLVTKAWPVRSVWSDTYDDASKIVATSGVSVASGALSLAGSPGSYPSTGTSTSVTISPASLDRWLLLTADGSRPAGTLVCHHVEYDTGGGVFALISDSDLPGNASGLCGVSVDLSVLATSAYPALRITSVLTSNDNLITPTVDALALSYLEPDVATPNVSFSLRGSKTIGTDAGGNQIYKFSNTYQTNSAGIFESGDLEWDVYELTVSGVQVANACPILPLVLDPGTTHDQTITTAPASGHSLKVQVLDALGAAIHQAEVRVQGSGTDVTRATDECGVAYFPLATAATYTVDVRAANFATTSTPVAVSGVTTSSITLVP